MSLASVFSLLLCMLEIKVSEAEGHNVSGDQQISAQVQIMSFMSDPAEPVNEEIIGVRQSFFSTFWQKIYAPNSVCKDGNFAAGHCLGLKDCPNLQRIVKDPKSVQYRFFRLSHCGTFRNIQHFCCRNENIVRRQNITYPIKLLPPIARKKMCQSSATINSDYCGKTKRTPHRTQGSGSSVPIGAWPWAALLGTNVEDPSFNGCGGALITDRHVLTAAHCLKNKTEKNLFVRLGEHNLTSNRDGRTVDIPVSKITRHPKYNGNFHDDDIAILHLASGVCFKDRITPICVPEMWWNARNLTHSAVWIIGWGLDGFGGRETDTLKEDETLISEDSLCRSAYRNDKKIRSFDGVLCAGSHRNYACQGDSGNALNYRLDDRFYAVGVVSFGKGCGSKGFPGVYTKTSKYYEWIRQTTLRQTTPV